MNTVSPPPAAATAIEAHVDAAAALLGAMANPRRLVILCHLLEGERTVTELAGLAGLQIAAASQHLAKMRDLGLVGARRTGQQIRYGLKSEEVAAIIATLHRLYCEPAEGKPVSPRTAPAREDPH